MSKAITGTDLARQLSKQFPELGMRKCEVLVRSMTLNLAQALKDRARSGESEPRVRLHGLGVLSVHLAPGHPGVHPTTMEDIERPPKVRGRFRPAARLAEQLDDIFLNQGG